MKMPLTSIVVNTLHSFSKHIIPIVFDDQVSIRLSVLTAGVPAHRPYSRMLMDAQRTGLAKPNPAAIHRHSVGV